LTHAQGDEPEHWKPMRNKVHRIIMEAHGVITEQQGTGTQLISRWIADRKMALQLMYNDN
jgi:hypothetical protein